MKNIQLSRNNDRDWSKQMMDDSHYDQLIQVSTLVRREDGSPLVIFLKGAIDQSLNAQAWSVLKKYKSVSTNRGKASGTTNAKWKKSDGTMSGVTRVPPGWEVESGAVGFFERGSRWPYCHALAWNDQNPDKFTKLFPLVERVNELYKENATEKWEYQKTFVDRTPKEYLISNTVFSTLTVNKNFRTACHKDAGDLSNGFSAMTVIRQGAYTGANLVLPNYRIAVDVQMGDLILFDPHEFHGNTQLVRLTPDAKRCSIVYYYRELMCKCLPMEEELRRAQNRKVGDPLFE